jgi:transposase-like protein
VTLFVSDQSAAIRQAVAEVFPESAWQHCTFHRLQALRQDVGPTQCRSQMVRQAAEIFRCPTKLAAVDRAVAWARQWRQQSPWAVQQFMENLTDSLMFYSLPKAWWRRVRTNNYMERLIRTLQMRLRPIGSRMVLASSVRMVLLRQARGRACGLRPTGPMAPSVTYTQ